MHLPQVQMVVTMGNSLLESAMRHAAAMADPRCSSCHGTGRIEAVGMSGSEMCLCRPDNPRNLEGTDEEVQQQREALAWAALKREKR
jgi:hypothetical protein